MCLHVEAVGRHPMLTCSLPPSVSALPPSQHSLNRVSTDIDVDIPSSVRYVLLPSTAVLFCII